MRVYLNPGDKVIATRVSFTVGETGMDIAPDLSCQNLTYNDPDDPYSYYNVHRDESGRFYVVPGQVRYR